MVEQILPVEDADIAAFARKQFEKQGITIHTGATVSGLADGASGVVASIDLGDETKQAEFDRVILAVGIVGNVEELGLEGTGVVVDRSHIETDAWGATGEAGVWAIGDVAGPPWLAHKATHEGVLVAERIAGVEGLHPLDTTKIPGCTYCRPQIASVGFTEKRAREAGYEVRIGSFPFVGNGKAIALGESEGIVKTVFDAKTGELLRGPHGGGRGDGADPGLHDRAHARDDRGRAHAHGLPASDAVGDDARVRPRRVRTRAPHLAGRDR